LIQRRSETTPAAPKSKGEKDGGDRQGGGANLQVFYPICVVEAQQSTAGPFEMFLLTGDRLSLVILSESRYRAFHRFGLNFLIVVPF